MRNRSQIATALVFILAGGWFLALEFAPGLKAFAYGAATWPLPMIGLGGLMVLIGLVTWTPGMMVPAFIVGGIGGILYWQNSTENWGSWAYTWTLIPAFVGVGMFISGLMRWKRQELIGSAWTVMNSLILFAIFGAWLGGLTGIIRFWPVLVILIGLLLLARAVPRHT